MITLDDPVSAFADAMRAAGIEPPLNIIADSKLHRFATNGHRGDDAGAYVFYIDGTPAGWFCDWRSGVSETWCSRRPDTLTPAEREAWRARVERARVEAAAEREREHARAAKTAEHVWRRGRTVGSNHPYFMRKRVQPTRTLHELTADELESALGYSPAAQGAPLAGRVLIAPIMIDGKISSVELIDEAGRKAFLKGGAIAGGFWATAKLPDGDGERLTILIGEGVATVLSAGEATGHISVAALSAGNLLAAARAIRARYPGATIVVLAELDENGRGQAAAEEAAHAIGGLVAVPDFADERPASAKDFNDLSVLRGPDVVRICIDEAKPPKEPPPAKPAPETQEPAASAPPPPSSDPSASNDDAEIARLVKLQPIAYGRELRAAAKRLGCRVSDLDCEVKRARGETSTAGQGRPLELPEPEPWPKPVDGAALLDAITAAVSRYVVMDTGAAECMALWAIHAHALDAFGISPRLAITSPRLGCGKTTLMDVVFHLVPRPIKTENISTAAIYRTIEETRPTLLVDEADTFLLGNDEMRGILNSGHRRGGSVIRIVGDDLEPRQFATWGACAVAMIGKLPGTLADRSIPIQLKRKRPSEEVEPFRFDRTDALDTLNRKAARWAKDNIARLREMDPLVPASLSNRQGDNWRVLLAISDAAGGDWPRKAREIAAAMVDADQSRRTALLADIRDVFTTQGCDRISSAELVAALIGLEGHDWAELRNGRPLTVNGLARLLAADGVAPATIRVGSSTPKGYRLEQFRETFERYLPPPPLNQTATPQHSAENRASPGFFDPPHEDECCGSQAPGNPQDSAICCGVADENPLPWGEER